MSHHPQLQQPHRPPAQPAYVLRGHAAHVHAVRFLRHNSRLLTGDADGWVVLWNVATKRAVAVWRAHDGAILGFGTWAEDKLVTHGRDFHLRVWQLGPAHEKEFSTVLPIDDTTADRKQPWLLHSLPVNTLNFCSFAICPEQATSSAASTETTPSGDPVLIAVPSTKDDQVDIFQLPSERRVSTVPNIGQKTGLIMSISLQHSPSPSGPLHCITGYEKGIAAVHTFSAANNAWSRIYTSQPHTQPILSLSSAPPLSSPQQQQRQQQPPSPLTFYTSAADDLIAKHTATAPSPPSPTPPAPPSSSPSPNPAQPQSLLSTALASQPSSSSAPPPLPNPAPPAPVAPARTSHTKHAGQQSLTVRSDGRVLATAGWDGRVRVYAAGSLREVAVLAWHKEGCYAVAFADVGPPAVGVVVEGGGEKGGGGGGGGGDEDGKEEVKEVSGGGVSGDGEGREGGALVDVGGRGDGGGGERTVVGRRTAAARTTTTVRSRREERATAVHWLAAGSKDGKVSLWEVF